MKIPEKPERQWIIQRCINAFENHYEDWPGYSETLLTYDQMRKALDACNEQWPSFEFRGHNVVNQKPGESGGGKVCHGSGGNSLAKPPKVGSVLLILTRCCTPLQTTVKDTVPVARGEGRRERQMKQFKSAGQVQRFLSTHDQINNQFYLRRDHVTAAELRASRSRRFHIWAEICGVV